MSREASLYIKKKKAMKVMKLMKLIKVTKVTKTTNKAFKKKVVLMKNKRRKRRSGMAQKGMSSGWCGSIRKSTRRPRNYIAIS